MPLQMLRCTQEATFGVFNSSPTTGQQQDIFLPVSNAYTMRSKPLYWMVRDAGQGNRLIRKNVGRIALGGSLTTYLFPTQAAFFLGLATTLNGTAPCYDLGSFTIDHVIYENGCGTIYKRYLGCKIAGLTLTADQSDGGQVTTLKADIVGSTVATITGSDFPVQSYSAYPAEDPFLFRQTQSLLTVGSTRSNYQGLTFGVHNMVKPFADENVYAQIVSYFGRDIGLGVKGMLLKSNADRAAYEAGTKQAVSVEFNNGTKTLTLDLNGTVNTDNVEDDLPLDDFYTQSLDFSALIDPSVSTDFSFTTT